MSVQIPQSLKTEHEELHQELKRATGEAGPVGEAARAVAEALHPHFLKEEEYALPPLGLLSSLAGGGSPADAAAVLEMTRRLKEDLGRMLEEHRIIVGRLERLVAASKRAKQPQHIRFAEKLMLHARMEEEVLYPAALLVGEHLRPTKRPRGRDLYLVHD